MQREFKITDRCYGEDLTATVVVDTLIDDHDMFYIKEVRNEKGKPCCINQQTEEQLLHVFIMEYEEEYNAMILQCDNEAM